MSITLRHEIRKSWGFQPWLHRNVVHLANRRIMPHMITERSEQKNDARGPLLAPTENFTSLIESSGSRRELLEIKVL